VFNFSLAVGLAAVTDESLALCAWHLLRRLIIHLPMHVDLWIFSKSTDTHMETMWKLDAYPTNCTCRTNHLLVSSAWGKNTRSRTSAYAVVASTGTTLRS